jgi:hypothetical protein
MGELARCAAADGVDDDVELCTAKCLGQIGFQIVIVDDDAIPAPAADVTTSAES